MEALASLEAMGAFALVDALLQDRYSKSAAASNLSLLRTWRQFHLQVSGHVLHPLPLLPMTVRVLVMIGALFKAGGYRSYPNYVSAMRSKHLEAGHEWCQLLLHTSAWVTRSVLRGIGPERQSCCFDFPRLRDLPWTSAPLVELGPCNPYHMAVYNECGRLV